ncbi:hypothetical protein [Legionella gresilensis]|uniref:hypothetical protein n=1 Tax=Legionella gresilensis TaxID=91823 RepID=UPI0010416A62|nr:hypothetical protein [Legionella gresilensis]
MSINRFFSQPPVRGSSNTSYAVDEKSATDEVKDKIAQFARSLPAGLSRLSATIDKIKGMNTDPAKQEGAKDAFNRVSGAGPKILSIAQNPNFRFDEKAQVSQETFKAQVQPNKVVPSAPEAEPQLSDSTPRFG